MELATESITYRQVKHTVINEFICAAGWMQKWSGI